MISVHLRLAKKSLKNMISNSKIQIFFITYAGGTASFFSKLEDELYQKFEVYKCEYAGHGVRQKEPMYCTMQDAVDDVARYISSHRDYTLPYVIFAYSMGSLIVTNALEQYFVEDMPMHIFFASHVPPHVSKFVMDLSLTPDEEFLDMLEKMGGVNEKLRNNRVFRMIYLPIIKNDYHLLYDYRWSGKLGIFPCDLTVLYSSEDLEEDVMRQWERYTKARFELHSFSGNHFFLKEHYQEVANLINTI